MADHMTAEQLRAALLKLAEVASLMDPEKNEDAKRADHLDSELRRLAARLSGMAAGWQPIETAPKRTRVIVGYHNSQGKWRTAMATYFTEDDIADWENDDCSPGWYERSYAHEAENEYVYALEAGPRCWQSLPPEPPHV